MEVNQYYSINLTSHQPHLSFLFFIIRAPLLFYQELSFSVHKQKYITHAIDSIGLDCDEGEYILQRYS
jgi:hypothetical protein